MGLYQFSHFGKVFLGRYGEFSGKMIRKAFFKEVDIDNKDKSIKYSEPVNQMYVEVGNIKYEFIESRFYEINSVISFEFAKDFVGSTNLARDDFREISAKEIFEIDTKNK